MVAGHLHHKAARRSCILGDSGGGPARVLDGCVVNIMLAQTRSRWNGRLALLVPLLLAWLPVQAVDAAATKSFVLSYFYPATYLSLIHI